MKVRTLAISQKHESQVIQKRQCTGGCGTSFGLERNSVSMQENGISCFPLLI